MADSAEQRKQLHELIDDLPAAKLARVLELVQQETTPERFSEREFRDVARRVLETHKETFEKLAK